MKLTKLTLGLLLIAMIFISGCQASRNSPEFAVQQLLRAIEKQDQVLFYKYTASEDQEQSFTELVANYFGDALDRIGIDKNTNPIEVSFRNLTYTVTTKDNLTSIVTASGYIGGKKSGKEALFEKDFTTIQENEIWLVRFLDMWNTQNLSFIL